MKSIKKLVVSVTILLGSLFGFCHPDVLNKEQKGDMVKKKMIVAAQDSPFVSSFCSSFNTSPIILKPERFADGESYLCTDESVSFTEQDVLLIFQFFGGEKSETLNDRLVQFLVLADFLKKRGAFRITAVLPYLPYGRQDTTFCKGFEGPISMITRCFEQAGVDSIVCCDIHTERLHDLCASPLKPMPADAFWAEQLRSSIDNLSAENTCVVAPDAGGFERANAVADRLSLPIIALEKRRTEADVSKVVQMDGDVTGKRTIIIDDIIDTAGTAVNAASLLAEKGAESIIGCFTHPTLSASAIERLSGSSFEKVLITDSLLVDAALLPDKCQLVGLGEACAQFVRDCGGA